MMLLFFIITYFCALNPCHKFVLTRTNLAWFGLVGWFLNVLVNYKVISRTGPKTERLTILHAATHETELGDHDFCLSRSHYTDTDPTSKFCLTETCKEYVRDVHVRDSWKLQFYVKREILGSCHHYARQLHCSLFFYCFCLLTECLT